MASIGDLIMRVVADMKGFNTQVTKQATKTGEQAGKNMTKGMAKGSSLKGGILAGLGLGAGLGLISATTRAVGALTDAIGDSIKMAISDQESQSRLRASLAANVKGWDGNTDAIEKSILASQRLGFDDETLRDSLTVLAGSTHDVAAAQKIQATAMDLARFKGIDLRTASEALIKVQSGQYRSLKQLGIVLRKGATQQEALAAVQAVANGQAEAYADTLAGKLLANQIRFNEAMETFGQRVIPIVSDGLELLVNATADASVGFEAFVKAAKSNNMTVVRQLLELQEAADKMGISVERAFDSFARTGKTDVDSIERDMADLRDEMDHAERTVNQKTDSIATGFDKMAEEAEESTVATTKSTQEMVDDMATEAGRLLDLFFDPIHAEEDRQDARRASNAAEEAFRTAETTEDKRQAARDIKAALEDEGRALETLGKNQDLSKKKVDLYEKDIKASYAAMGKKVPAELQKILDKLRTLAAVTSTPFKVRVQAPAFNPKTGGGDRNIDRRAAGGPVAAGRLYQVNEYGTEFFRPNVGGQVIPISPGARSGATAPNINVQLNGLPQTTDPFAVTRQLRRISDMGLLAPREERYG